jgi:hypothetical protein
MSVFPFEPKAIHHGRGAGEGVPHIEHGLMMNGAEFYEHAVHQDEFETPICTRLDRHI